MNRSRSHWSKDLKCCKKKVLFEPFIIASSLVLSLPIFFYLGCYLYTKRVERRQRAMITANNMISSEVPRESYPSKVSNENQSSNINQDPVAGPSNTQADSLQDLVAI